jgi:hypothetical protein
MLAVASVKDLWVVKVPVQKGVARTLQKTKLPMYPV